jgi:hypothetical protein
VPVPSRATLRPYNRSQNQIGFLTLVALFPETCFSKWFAYQLVSFGNLPASCCGAAWGAACQGYIAGNTAAAESGRG